MHTLEQSADSKRGLLEEAISVVCGDRNNAYGPPSQDFLRTATMLNAAWDHKLAEPLEAHDVAILMVLLKVSRLQWSPERRDSWVDIAGYAACGWQCIDDAQATERQDAEDLANLLVRMAMFEDEQPEPHCTAGPEFCGACADQVAQQGEHVLDETCWCEPEVETFEPEQGQDPAIGTSMAKTPAVQETDEEIAAALDRQRQAREALS